MKKLSDKLKYHLFSLTHQRFDITGQTEQRVESSLNSKEKQTFPKEIWNTETLCPEAEQSSPGAEEWRLEMEERDYYKLAENIL